MKYNKEQLLKAIPVLCILLGVLLIGGGFAMADFKMENMRTVEQKPFIKKEKTFSADNLAYIQIDTHYSEINILPSEDSEIHVQYEENDPCYCRFLCPAAEKGISHLSVSLV